MPIILADRWHVLPSAITAAPAREVFRWLSILGIEGETLAQLEGLDPNEPIYWDDDE